MKYIKIFESFGEINNICNKYDIQRYEVNSDGSINVDGSVNLTYYKLTKLPIKFGIVRGSFDCAYNMLTSLEGCPSIVDGHFDCAYNNLTSLVGCPEVGGRFYCDGNKINTFEGFPKKFEKFYCEANPIINIWILFRDVDKVELFNEYDIIRGDDLILDRLNDFLVTIGKEPVENVEGYNNI